MTSRLLRRLAAASAAAVTVLSVPAATPASAAVVRVMQWHAFGTWSCGARCGDGSASLSGSSGNCGQTGVDLETGAAPRVALNYACSASFTGTPTGTCVAGVCAVTGGHVTVDVSDPNAGTTLTFDGDIQGATVSTTEAGVRVLTLRSAGVTTASPSTAWSLEAVLVGWGCEVGPVECAGVAPPFALTLTQSRVAAP